MTQKVPGERSQSAHPSPWNSPGLPSREARFTAWFLVYGIHFGLFGLSWVLVFVNPLTSVMPTFAAGAVVYVTLGFLWGVTLPWRLSLRSHRQLLRLRLLKDRRASTYKPSPVDFGEFSFFGEWVGRFISVMLVLLVGVLYIPLWPLGLMLEIAFWADSQKR